MALDPADLAAVTATLARELAAPDGSGGTRSDRPGSSGGPAGMTGHNRGP